MAILDSRSEDKIAEWDDIFLSPQEGNSVWLEFDVRSVPGSLHVLRSLSM